MSNKSKSSVAGTNYDQNRLDDEIRTASPEWISPVDYARLVVFTHVPKTGGTTLKQILTIHYGQHFADHHPRIQNLIEEIDQGEFDPAQLLALSSHQPYGVHRKLAGLSNRRILPITVVREPLARLISMYNFVTTFRPHRLHQATKNMDINEFFRFAIEEGVSEIGDSQSRLVGGRRRTFSYAKEILETEYFAYTTLEGMSAMVEEVGQLLGWPVKPEEEKDRRANQSPKRQTWEDVDSDIADKLIEMNSEDLALYEFLLNEGPVVRSEMLSESGRAKPAQ